MQKKAGHILKKEKKMSKKMYYESPSVKVVLVEVEQGFAVSYGTGGGAGPEQYQSVGSDFF